MNMNKRKNIEDLKDSNYIDLLKEEVKKNTSPLRSSHNYYCLGLAYSQAGSHQEALNALCEAYVIYNDAKLPEKSPLYGELILVSINELVYFGKYLESLDFIDELLNISPDLPDAFFYRGICLQSIGRVEQAIDTYKYALELLNSTEESDKNLNPLEIMSKAKALIPDLMYKLSLCYVQTANKKLAMDYLKKLEALNIYTDNELKFLRDKIGRLEV